MNTSTISFFPVNVDLSVT